MTDAYVLYAVPGWGSVLAEAMLSLCGAPFRIEDVTGFDQPGPALSAIAAKVDALPTLAPVWARNFPGWARGPTEASAAGRAEGFRRRNPRTRRGSPDALPP